ncbi:MAG TPA: SDR family NAD(P)-dependent oxidoreductase [Xanthobacteraceae bacterium]
MSDPTAPRSIYPDLSGKVALVTGSSRGIGAETARHLAANQTKVVINGRQAEAVERVVAEINASGGAAIGCVADCSQADQVEGMRRQIERRFGAVSLLFAFAGGDGKPEPLEQLTEERWDAVMAGNLKSKFFTVKSFLPGMKQQRAGSIVLMCSAAGRAPSQASLAYSSAQAGVSMLTRNLAQQVGNAGVRVNAVAPSTVMNDNIRKFMPEDQQRSLAASYPVPRLGAPADVAAAAVFLSSDAASWITGIVLDVAGGKVML